MSIQTADLISALTALGVLPKAGGVPLTPGVALRGFGLSTGNATSAGTLAANAMTGRKMVIPRKMNLTAFFYVNAATAGGTIEGGFYAIHPGSPNGSPGTKVADFGQIAMDTGATLVQGATFDIEAGEYWQIEHNGIATSTNGVHRLIYQDGENVPQFNNSSRVRVSSLTGTPAYVSPMLNDFSTYAGVALGAANQSLGFLFRINSVG